MCKDSGPKHALQSSKTKCRPEKTGECELAAKELCLDPGGNTKRPSFFGWLSLKGNPSQKIGKQGATGQLGGVQMIIAAHEPRQDHGQLLRPGGGKD